MSAKKLETLTAAVSLPLLLGEGRVEGAKLDRYLTHT